MTPTPLSGISPLQRQYHHHHNAEKHLIPRHRGPAKWLPWLPSLLPSKLKPKVEKEELENAKRARNLSKH